MCAGFSCGAAGGIAAARGSATTPELTCSLPSPLSGTTDALKDGTTPEYEKKCTGDLMKIVDLVRGELTNLQRATLGGFEREFE